MRNTINQSRILVIFSLTTNKLYAIRRLNTPLKGGRKIQFLLSSLKEKRLTFLLDAGASASCGVLLWGELKKSFLNVYPALKDLCERERKWRKSLKKFYLALLFFSERSLKLIFFAFLFP